MREGVTVYYTSPKPQGKEYIGPFVPFVHLSLLKLCSTCQDVQQAHHTSKHCCISPRTKQVVSILQCQVYKISALHKLLHLTACNIFWHFI